MPFLDNLLRTTDIANITVKATVGLLSVMACGALSCLTTWAATLYVSQESPTPTAPYTNWSTAALTVQDAVDAARTGDLVLVTNGAYASGGRPLSTNLLTNRVAIDKAITLKSVNGPTVTWLVGAGAAEGGNGDDAVRCVYLGTNAVLNGFTITNGFTGYLDSDGAGVWSEASGVITNCVLTGNDAWGKGGGAFGGTLVNCTLTRNSAYSGAGASAATLARCALRGNSAIGYSARGGAASRCALYDCALWENLVFCQAGGIAGGAFESTLYNCTVTRNSVVSQDETGAGGGTYRGTLYNCTVVGNWADGRVGGTFEGSLYNCIVYFNTASWWNIPDNSFYSAFVHSCTIPIPTDGIGNITSEPAFVNLAEGNLHLRYGSPCMDAGTNLSAIFSNDLDGHPRPLDGNGDGIAAFDIGAYEFVPRYVWQGSPAPAPPYTNWATAAHTIQDAVDIASSGDLVLVTNGVYASGGRAVFGATTNRVSVDKPLMLASVNGPEFTLIQGYQVPGITNADGAIRCAYLTNGVVLSGFTLTNGATGGDSDLVQEVSGGGVWCESTTAAVSNCVLVGNSALSGGGAYGGILDNCTITANSAYLGGGVSSGTLSNCALVGNVAYRGGGTHESTLNNCALTGNSAVQAGGGAFGGTLNNCGLSGNSASGGGGASWSALNNCTLALNLAHDSGGGVSGGTLNSCTLTHNSASLYGGGVAGSTLTNCALIGNSSDYWGGGAYESTLINCTLTGNSANKYGGAYWCNLYNCIVYFNTAAQDPNFDYRNTLMSFCCTTPMPAYGFGNTTNEPAFVNPAVADIRLETNSPCINSGNNAYAANSGGDLGGNPRIVRRTVDIGAYEYQGTGSVISYAWLQQYGLPTDGSADYTDPDLDNQANWHEWRADTNPTNASSCLRLTIVSNTPPVAVTFSSSAARLYALQCCTNLTPTSVWTPVPGQSDMPGSGGVLTLSDTNPPAPAFYRVSVRFP